MSIIDVSDRVLITGLLFYYYLKYFMSRLTANVFRLNPFVLILFQKFTIIKYSIANYCNGNRLLLFDNAYQHVREENVYNKLLKDLESLIYIHTNVLIHIHLFSRTVLFLVCVLFLLLFCFSRNN